MLQYVKPLIVRLHESLMSYHPNSRQNWHWLILSSLPFHLQLYFFLLYIFFKFLASLNVFVLLLLFLLLLSLLLNYFYDLTLVTFAKHLLFIQFVLDFYELKICYLILDSFFIFQNLVNCTSDLD